MCGIDSGSLNAKHRSPSWCRMRRLVPVYDSCGVAVCASWPDALTPPVWLVEQVVAERTLKVALASPTRWAAHGRAGGAQRSPALRTALGEAVEKQAVSPWSTTAS
jgi:hypothetical protein